MDLSSLKAFLPPFLRTKIKQLFKLDDTPENIALSFAIGVFITINPLYGLHTVIAIIIFSIFRMNKFAVLLGSALNVPWLALFTYFFCYYVGTKIWQLIPFLDNDRLYSETEFRYFFSSWQGFRALFQPSHFMRIFLPTMLGSTVVGLFSSLASYYMVREVIIKLRSIRQRKLQKLAVSDDQTPDF